MIKKDTFYTENEQHYYVTETIPSICLSQKGYMRSVGDIPKMFAEAETSIFVSRYKPQIFRTLSMSVFYDDDRIMTNVGIFSQNRIEQRSM
jgi:hypothetical protein